MTEDPNHAAYRDLIRRNVAVLHGTEADEMPTDGGVRKRSVPDYKPPTHDHIMQFFAYEHLPPHLQAVSRPFCDLAWMLVEDEVSPGDPFPLPRNPERTVALRKLLEAKDAAVRALVAK